MLSNHTTEPIVPQLLTLRQVAELCGVSERTLWGWARSGISPGPYKFGSNKQSIVRYSRAEYEAWLQDGCKPVNKEKTDQAGKSTKA